MCLLGLHRLTPREAHYGMLDSIPSMSFNIQYILQGTFQWVIKYPLGCSTSRSLQGSLQEFTINFPYMTSHRLTHRVPPVAPLQGPNGLWGTPKGIIAVLFEGYREAVPYGLPSCPLLVPIMMALRVAVKPQGDRKGAIRVTIRGTSIPALICKAHQVTTKEPSSLTIKPHTLRLTIRG